ncbi:ribonuclease HI family protein [Rickettsiella endosymbiont of Dermanyssus gallinae]|uniref:ribonuclease HI family protein n=1 Tax=Rickettsiella endosymbiont of Dermanyssus gallinae TaxID=2856608 RepID=UPI001C530EF1|nr:ribonuclease HI family protein [Rickettsiella endosymbiont of Dermanyssus gallinae]
MNKKNKNKFIAYFDGCCEPINPGGVASYGAVIFKNEERIWECSELFVPIKGKEKMTSNNVAEYSGFLAILEYLKSQSYENESITIYGDSKLVINQMNPDPSKVQWKMRQGFYIPVARKAKKVLQNFTDIHLEWIPRDENDIADELSKAELKKAGVEFRIQPED